MRPGAAPRGGAAVLVAAALLASALLASAGASSGAGAAVSTPVAGAAPAAGATVSTAATDTLPKFVADALSLYRAPPDSAGAGRILARWARHGGPRDAVDSLAAAVLWRRAGVPGAALNWVPRGSRPDARPPSAARLDLERSRILALAGRAEEALEALRDACAAADAGTIRELWLDLRGLATPPETSGWEGAPGAGSACCLALRMLEERAWRMAITPAERLVLHHRRLAAARARYWLRRPRFTRDLSDRLGRADSLELDDRGLVLLRLGGPHAVSGTAAADLEANETWAYGRPGGARLFHFAAVSRAFGGGFQPVGDYRLLENLAHATGLTLTGELLAIGGARIAALYASRSGIDPGLAGTGFRYAEAQRRMRAAGDPFDPGLLAILGGERERTLADARHVMTEIADVPAVEPRLRLATEALRFEEADGEVEVWLLASVRAGDLARAGGAGGAGVGSGYAVALRAAVDGPLGVMTAAGEARADVRPPGEADGITLRVRLRLPPGRWPLTVAVRDLGSGEPPAGAWVRDTLSLPAPVGPPRLSDVALAPDSGGAWTRDGRVFLRPQPLHRTGTDGRAHAYFEVYGVPAGAPYEVEARLVAGDAGEPFAPGAQARFGLRFASAMPADGTPGRHHLALDLAAVPPGAYRLALRAREDRSGATSLPVLVPLVR